MKIAIDIDEVVIEFVESYMEFVRSKGYRDVSYESVFSYELWDILGITKELVFELLAEYYESRYVEKRNLIEGAKVGVEFLRDNHDVVFITARPKYMIKETRDFIFEEFGILGDRIFFSGDVLGEGRSKDEICRGLGIGLIIEDSEADSLRYAKNGLKVLLLDKPWNRNIRHENIVRCFGWDDVLREVRRLDNG